MAGKREKPEDIVSKLRQVEVLQGQGATIAEAVVRRSSRHWSEANAEQADVLSVAEALWRDAAFTAHSAERA